VVVSDDVEYLKTPYITFLFWILFLVWGFYFRHNIDLSFGSRRPDFSPLTTLSPWLISLFSTIIPREGNSSFPHIWTTSS